MASYTYEEVEVVRCKCCRLKTGVDLPIPKELSEDEIPALASKFSHKIFANWTQLNAILKRFEPTIQKRWLKKSLKQKREILLKAWPGMSATHRPDFASFRESSRRNIPRSRTCVSDAHLWPYINLEDLQQHRILLLFLNSRGRNLPEMFMTTDLRSAHVGPGWDFGEESDNTSPIDKKSMQFHSQRSPRSYGRILDHEAARYMLTIQPYIPHLGLFGLEIQDGIYSFLLSCAKLILHDIDPKQFLLAPHVPAPGLPAALTDEWPSLSAHMLETPYRTSQKMDVDRLKMMVMGRRGAAEDHLWFLQEDPAYLLDAIKDWKEHSPSELRSTCECCLNGSGETMIQDAVINFLNWDFVFRQLDSMPTMDVQLKRADWKNLRLHREDEEAWSTLHDMIEAMELCVIDNLRDGVPSSPRMRHCYDWKALRDAHDSIWHRRRGFTEAEYRIDMLFYALVNQHERELHSLNKIVQEIQYMLDTDTKASQQIDSWIVGHFSDLAMLSDLKQRIYGMQPWFAIWRNEKMVKAKYELETLEGPLIDFVELNDAVRTTLRRALTKSKIVQDPLDGTFDYPDTKRYTKANVDQMRRAEAELDAFWYKIEMVFKKSAMSLKRLISQRLLEPRELHRTPEWMPSLMPQKVASPLATLNSNVPRYETSSAASVTTPAKAKTKIKTRGVASSLAVVDEPSSTNPMAEESSTPKIAVNKRIYKTLAALLPDCCSESHQRVEVSWDELLQAMNAIGLQPEKLYGSVWMFRPKADGLVNVKRSIQFHEPKEVRKGNKIPPNMVRTFGRRLKHAYGWDSEIFVCA